MDQQMEQLDSRIRSLSAEISVVHSEMGSVVSQLQVINPGALLEFKGTVLEALKTFDKDFDNVDLEMNRVRTDVFKVIQENRLDIEKKLDKVSDKADKNELDIERIKAKAAVISGLVATGFLVLLEVFKHFILK